MAQTPMPIPPEPRSFKEDPDVKFDRVPEVNASNDQLAAGINKLHDCIEGMNMKVDGMALVVLPLQKKVEDFEKLPGKALHWLMLTACGVALSQGVTWTQNFILHRETSASADKAAATATIAADHAASADAKTTAIAKAVGADPTPAQAPIKEPPQ